MNQQRLPRSERRAQLMHTARQVIADEGADALTLGLLAIRSGVSKPVVYDHFPTRAALLIALYEDLDNQHLSTISTALADTAPVRAEQVRAIADAYVSCMVDHGAEVAGIVAALGGSPELERARQECDQRYLDVCRDALRRSKTNLDDEAAIAFLGAAEALGTAAAQGNISAAAAKARAGAVLLMLTGTPERT